LFDEPKSAVGFRLETCPHCGKESPINRPGACDGCLSAAAALSNLGQAYKLPHEPERMRFGWITLAQVVAFITGLFLPVIAIAQVALNLMPLGGYLLKRIQQGTLLPHERAGALFCAGLCAFLTVIYVVRYAAF
jgi:hypothetical protein